jgi:hypothetical protein
MNRPVAAVRFPVNRFILPKQLLSYINFLQMFCRVLFKKRAALKFTFFLEDKLNELAQYLIENIILDFEGDVTTETVRAYLRKDDGPQARALLQRIIEEKGIDELLLTTADILTQELAKKFTVPEVREHLISYSEA